MGMVPRLFLVVIALLAIVLTPIFVMAADWRPVTDDRLLKAEADAANWLMYNRTYNGWRTARSSRSPSPMSRSSCRSGSFGWRARRAAGDPNRQRRRDVHDVDGTRIQPRARHQRRRRGAPVETPSGRCRKTWARSRGSSRTTAAWPCTTTTSSSAPSTRTSRPRGEDRQAGLGDEDRGPHRRLLHLPGAHGRQRQGDRGHRRARRDGAARLRRGVRRQDRQEPVALVLDSRRW